MRSLILVLPFIAIAFLSWGVYGPVLHEGQYGMGAPLEPSSLRPFICVGIAYFLIAVVAPLVVLRTKGETGHWTLSGAVWSFAAGAAGAIGAMGIILAFKFRGNPVYVMPLVFGLAPVVNTLVTMSMARTFRQAGGLFLAGIVAVAVGAAGVLLFKPVAKNVEVTELADGSIEVALKRMVRSDSGMREWKTTEWNAKSLDELRTNSELEKAYRLYLKKQPLPLSQWATILASIAFTALCWGSYGPILHKGQMKMQGSRLRPFLCVGLAYFAIAVLAPMPLLQVFEEPGGWTLGGAAWSLAAGAAGAIGALGIILAFNFGGRPIYVMPLVFGGAPVVNTLTTVVAEGTVGDVGIMFYVSLALVILGAVVVLVFAPRRRKTAAPRSDGSSEGSIATADTPSATGGESASAGGEPSSSSDSGTQSFGDGATLPDEDSSDKTAADVDQESDEDTFDSEDTHDQRDR
ncbi:MAG: hypothetical protein H8E44_32100 [Planctomycetes bacterium]|nr:hypothetical protein [Planctomycetota bacterium]